MTTFGPMRASFWSDRSPTCTGPRPVVSWCRLSECPLWLIPLTAFLLASCSVNSGPTELHDGGPPDSGQPGLCAATDPAPDDYGPCERRDCDGEQGWRAVPDSDGEGSICGETDACHVPFSCEAGQCVGGGPLGDPAPESASPCQERRCDLGLGWGAVADEGQEGLPCGEPPDNPGWLSIFCASVEIGQQYYVEISSYGGGNSNTALVEVTCPCP